MSPSYKKSGKSGRKRKPRDLSKMCRKNVEFEAKVIQDLVSVVTGGVTIGSTGHSPEFDAPYREWILNSVDNGTIEEIVIQFHDFCSLWKGYSGNYSDNFFPEIIEKYFK